MRLIKQGLLVLIAFPLLFMAVLLANTAPAAAANPLLCFDGTTDTANGDTGGAVYGGVCTILPGGTSASLNNTVAGPNGQYSGVYYATSNLSGDLLTSITQLSFDFTGAATAGSPRISLPIDTNNNGTTDFFAFISGFHCNNGAGHVDPIHNASCLIFYTGGPVSGQTWAQFTANGGGTWRVATDTVPFVIADDVGFWTVSNVQLGQGENANVATAKDECKKGGWSNLTRADGSQFKNQGDCIQYVNTGK